MSGQTADPTPFPDGHATTSGGTVVLVKDVPQVSRFEAWVDGACVAYASYSKWDKTVVVLSTVTEAHWRGQGIASALTEAMLTVIRDLGWTIGPRCPFTADYLAGHEDQLDLVAAQYRGLVRRAFRPSAP